MMVRSLFVLAVLWVAPATAATITDLGKFLPIGVNRHGVVVGDIIDFAADDANGHAGVWMNGTATPLHERAGTLLSDALAVSDTGRIVGLEYVDSNNVHAVAWDGGTVTQIGPLSEDYDFSQAMDVDDSGNVVGVTTTSGDPSPVHYLIGFYAPGSNGLLPVQVGLGDLDVDKGSSKVGAISGDGTTMLGEVTGTDAADGFYLWSTAAPDAPGIKLDITPPRSGFAILGGSVYSSLLIQNTLASDGAVVGYKGGNDPSTRTWFLRTKDGTQTQIVGLFAINGINRRHVAVGTVVPGGPESVRAAKWDPVTKSVTDLNTLLPANSGWILITALAVGDNGDVVGVGAHNGVEAGFLLKGAQLSASAVTSTDRVKLDPNEFVVVTATLTNATDQTLTGVHASSDPTVAGTGAVELLEGPYPSASIDLAPGQSGTIQWRYKPTKAGKVTFTFADFADGSGTVHNDEGAISTGELKIVDLDVKVTVTPTPLSTNSDRGSFGVVRIKVTDTKGNPLVGQRVRLRIPHYVGQFSGLLDTKVLLCDANGARLYPPGDDPILETVRIATTEASGELTYGLWIGTERTSPPSTQLSVSAEAIDDAGALLGDDSEFVDLGTPEIGGGPGVGLAGTLNAQQTSELPPSQQTAIEGITGRHTSAVGALKALMRWLESEREANLDALKNVDFAPITSVDGKNAGVVFFPRGQGRAVLDHLNGTAPPPAGALVMTIEFGVGYIVEWPLNLMPLGTWETTRPLLPTGGENATAPVRGPAISAAAMFTNDPYAFFGFPYPTVSPTGGYSGSCLPIMAGVGIDVHSPVSLLVKDANGNGVGFDGDGAYGDTLDGAVYAGGEPSRYLVPPGAYTADITGTGSGPATIVMSSSTGAGVVAKTFTLKAKPGKTGTLTFDDSLAAPKGTFNKRKLKAKTGVALKVDLKKRLKIHTGDELTLSVQDAFGAPVQGARVHATGKGFDASTVTATDGSAAMPLLVTKAVKLTVEVSGPGLQTTKKKVGVKVLKK